jgi:integrase
MEASMAVRKRKGHWHFDFQIKGVRYREAIPKARNKWQAEQAEVQARLRVYEGTYGKQLGTQLFEDFVGNPDAEHDRFDEGTYLEWAKINKKSWRHDRFRARALLVAFKGKTLAEVSPLAIEKYKRDSLNSKTIRGTDRSATSVNRELELLSRIFSLAFDIGIVETNPCARVRKLRIDNQRSRYLSADEESRLLAQLTGKRSHLKPFVSVALGTGMRRGELSALQWKRVDFTRGVILVTQTKTAKDRIVPMSSEVRAELLALRSKSRSDYVFAGKKPGRPLVEIKRSFSGACNDADLTDFRFHDLRHTFATRLGDNGCNVTTIAALMGHSNIQMSARYTHAGDDAKRVAVEGVSQWRHKQQNSRSGERLQVIDSKW